MILENPSGITILAVDFDDFDWSEVKGIDNLNFLLVPFRTTHSPRLKKIIYKYIYCNNNQYFKFLF